MTQFRFRYKCSGYSRWRLRARRRPLALAGLPPDALVSRKPSAAAWRHHWPLPELPAPAVTALRVGDFVVGEDGDPQLQGHPDILY